jgi:hypothetical protein
MTRKRPLELFARDDRKHQGRPPIYLLSGIATCGQEGCGRPLVGASAGAKRPKYACRETVGTHFGCGRTWIDAPALYSYVTEMVITALRGRVTRFACSESVEPGPRGRAAEQMSQWGLTLGSWST